MLFYSILCVFFFLWAVLAEMKLIDCSVSVSAVNRMPLNQLAKMSATASTTTANSSTLLLAGASGMPVTDVKPLNDVFVPIETIQPGNSALTSPSPPYISPLESLLPRSVRTTLARLHSGHCRLLNSYKARITSAISDVCPECGVAPHSVEHLFNCQSHPTQLTVQDLWGHPAVVADFLNLDN